MRSSSSSAMATISASIAAIARAVNTFDTSRR
jgi:hypothetical protein